MVVLILKNVNNLAYLIAYSTSIKWSFNSIYKVNLEADSLIFTFFNWNLFFFLNNIKLH
jgi:hypothetical protein